MGSGAETVARNRRLPDGSRREGRRAEGPALSPVRPAGVPRRAAEDRPHAWPCSIGRRSRARPAIRSISTSRRRSPKRTPRASRRSPCRRAWSPAATACRRRSSRPRWSRPSSTNIAQGQAQASLHRRHRRRRDAHVAAVGSVVPDRVDDVSASVFYGLGADGTVGRQQELDQDRRPGNRALRAGLLRLRLEEVGRDHRLAPAHEQAADPLGVPGRIAPASSPAISSSSSTRSTSSNTRRPARRSC